MSAPAFSRLPGDRMAILFAVMLVTAAGNTAMQSVLPAIGTRLGIADYWVSAAFSWSALLWVMTAPRWARLSDRRGRKKLMNLGLFGFVSSMGLCGLILWLGMEGFMAATLTFVIFALFRSLYGGLGSAAPPAVQAYVAARTSRDERTRALSVLASSFGLGTVIGPGIAPYLIVPGIGLPSPLLMFALIGIAVMVALKYRLPRDDPQFSARGVVTSEPYSSAPSSNRLLDEEEEEDGGDTPEEELRWGDSRIRSWLTVGLIGGHAHAIALGLVGFLILDRLDLRGTPELAAEPTGTVLMAGAGATLLAQWGLIPLMQMSARTAVLWGVAIAAAGTLLVAVAGSLHSITIGFAVASLGFGLFRPGFTAGASLAVKRREQGRAAGMVASTNGAAFVAGPAFGVFLYNVYAPAVFALLIALCLAVIAVGVTALRLDPPATSPGG